MSSNSSINNLDKKIDVLTQQAPKISSKANAPTNRQSSPTTPLERTNTIYETATPTPKPSPTLLSGIASPQPKSNISIPSISSPAPSLESTPSAASTASSSYAKTFEQFKTSVEAAQVKTRNARKLTPWMTRIGGVTAGILLFTGHAPIAIAMAFVFPVVGAIIAKLFQIKLAKSSVVQDFQTQLEAVSQSPYFDEIQKTPEFKKAVEIQGFLASQYGGHILLSGLKKSVSPLFSIFSTNKNLPAETSQTAAPQKQE